MSQLVKPLCNAAARQKFDTVLNCSYRQWHDEYVGDMNRSPVINVTEYLTHLATNDKKAKEKRITDINEALLADGEAAQVVKVLESFVKRA